MARSAITNAARIFLVMRSPEIVQSVEDLLFLPCRSSKTPASVITSRLPHSEKLRAFRTDRLRGCTETFPESSPALRAIPASPATLAKPALQVHFRTVVRREVELPDMPAPRNHNLKQTKRHFGTPPNNSGKEHRLSILWQQKSDGRLTNTLCQSLKAFSISTRIQRVQRNIRHLIEFNCVTSILRRAPLRERIGFTLRIDPRELRETNFGI